MAGNVFVFGFFSHVIPFSRSLFSLFDVNEVIAKNGLSSVTASHLIGYFVVFFAHVAKGLCGVCQPQNKFFPPKFF